MIGGGISCLGGNPQIIYCTIVGNTSAQNGAGIHCSNNTGADVSNCLITDNYSIFNGGGIVTESCSPLFGNCDITNNTAILNGGGISFVGNSQKIINSRIEGNYSKCRGAGIYVMTSNPSILGCNITQNNALKNCGGLYSFNSYPQLRIRVYVRTAPYRSTANAMMLKALMWMRNIWRRIASAMRPKADSSICSVIGIDRTLVPGPISSPPVETSVKCDHNA